MKQGMLKIPYHKSETDKQVFEAWFSEGSLTRAQYKLTKDGVVGTHQTPLSISGLRLAASRYMINNYTESRQMLLDTYEKNGYIVGDEFIDRYMIKMAIYVLIKPERVKFWLVKNDLLEKHKSYIESLIALPND